jgi:hypothetical protein
MTSDGNTLRIECGERNGRLKDKKYKEMMVEEEIRMGCTGKMRIDNKR